MLKTPTSWTGCFIAPSLSIEVELFDNIKKYIITYSEEIGIDPSNIYLDKEYTLGKSAEEVASVLG